MNNVSHRRLSVAVLPQLRDALSWRWRFIAWPFIKRHLHIQNVQWMRVVMYRECERLVRTLPFETFTVLEVSPSASHWASFGFRSYRPTTYPEYDMCEQPLVVNEFDLVIADQVLEHVRYPHRAVRNAHQMLKPGGWFIVSTPFLIGVHGYPEDFTRWTEQGLKELLVGGGFLPEDIITGSWGNRACVKANLKRYASWTPWWHSLRNEPGFPIVVWAFGRRSGAPSGG
jgi:SAM-dependent methyltransferase